ncbi:MAG: VRR-NUC domain-containing protein [Ruminococcus sp.]|nr:VRR-NUC domain-containing protein [Ruminococcus sp.]
MKWFSLQFPDIRPLFFAVPNGGARNRIEAGIMKGEGVTAGVADMLLLYPNQRYHGLCIEFKTPKGTQQDSQKRWQRHVENAGYKYIIIRDIESFIDNVKAYIYNRDTAENA